MNLHALLRKLRSHGDKITGNLDRILKCHAWVIVAGAKITILYAQLPDHCPQPLLTSSEIRSLVFRRITKICRERFSQLLLQSLQIWR